jgi:hypothetical protein
MYWTFRSIELLDAVDGKFIPYNSVRSQNPGVPHLTEEMEIYIFLWSYSMCFISVKYFKCRLLSSQILECMTDVHVISENSFLKLLQFCRRHSSYQGCTFLGREVTVENKCCTVASNIWEFSLGKLLYYPSGAYKFEVAPRVQEVFHTPSLNKQ